MNTQKYRERLLELEKSLTSKTERSVAAGRAELIDSAHDTGDASVADEVASEQFSEAGQGAGALQEIRDALLRLDDRWSGKCIVDGKPIEEKRLDAVPWASRCLKHTEEIEKESGQKTPAL